MEEGHRPTRLSIQEVSKRFGPTIALDRVGLDLRSGEVHALLGANGSGKSTLIRILAGVERADAGRVIVAGRKLVAQDMNPAVAQECHLRFVHQQGSTFGSMSVAENLAAVSGYPRWRLGGIHWRRLRCEARATLERFGIDADPDELLEDVRPVTQQMVVIARLLQGQDDVHAGVLVLDEATAALPRPEVVLLHEALRRYASAGQAILYATHRLEELAGFADRATVLREGRVAGCLEGDEIHHDQLVELISGSLATVEAPTTSRRASVTGEVRLCVREAQGGPVERACFEVRAGEVVGLAGLVGSGRTSLLEMIFGVRPLVAGTIELDGEVLPWRRGVPHQAVAYVPENRLRDGAFMPLTLTENVMAASTSRYWRRGRISRRREAHATRSVMRERQIVAGSETVKFRTLSGGNQQKAIVGRWLMREPTVLLLDEPTQGVDIGARAAIHKTIHEEVARGSVAIVASSDADELAQLCDRVILLVHGNTVAELAGDDLDPERIELLSYGPGRATAADLISDDDADGRASGP